MANNILMTDHDNDSLYYPPIGTPKDCLPTPALIINLHALEFNLSLMSNYILHKTTELHPHFKTHKCTFIARKQMESAAIGINCAKLSEAEVLVKAGDY
jgi:D-serine deaminase-like pyridoxal phosphate-dependent protein